MAKYRVGSKKYHGIPRAFLWLFLILMVISWVCLAVARHYYFDSLKPVSNSQQTQVVTVQTGSSVQQIANQLQKDHLIRSAWAMEIYVQSKALTDKLQAGTFAFWPSQGTASIVNTMTKGKVATRLVTILPGRRIDQVRADLINSGFSPTAVDQALNPSQYADLPVLGYKPADINTLEGLLWPDSFQKDPSTDPSAIVRESLVEMGQHLTPDTQAAFASQNLNVYQGITLSSLVLQEVNRPSDQTQAAQVFLSRLKDGSMLGSDAANEYGSIVAGRSPSDLTFDSPYNTHLHAGLPPTPISTINATSLYAVTHPANTNWLYFVTGDNGTTYFSTNLKDHEAQTQQYCHKLCGQ